MRRQTARFYRHTGQPGVDPVVLGKLALIGALSASTSERRRAAEVRRNLAFRWVLGDDLDEPTPAHSGRSKARRRFGVTVSQACCSEIVRQGQDAGLIAGDQVFADSPLVGARARLEQRAPPEASVAAPVPAEPPPAPPAEPPAASAAPAGAGPGAPPTGAQGPVNGLAARRPDPDAGARRQGPCGRRRRAWAHPHRPRGHRRRDHRRTSVGAAGSGAPGGHR